MKGYVYFHVFGYFKKYLFQRFKFSNWFITEKVCYKIPDFIRAASIAVEEERLKNRLTKWILLAGPAYENSRYKFPVLIETKKLLVWAISFGKALNLRNQNQLYSVRGLADKVTNANNYDETVTLLDESLREILEFYIPNLLRQNYLTVFCPHCRKLGVDVKIIYGEQDEEPNWECGQCHSKANEKITSFQIE